MRPTLSLLLMALKASTAGQLGGHLALLLLLRAELVAAAGIDEQDHGQLALLDKSLDERMADGASRFHIDGADIIAGWYSRTSSKAMPVPLEDAVYSPPSNPPRPVGPSCKRRIWRITSPVAMQTVGIKE